MENLRAKLSDNEMRLRAVWGDPLAAATPALLACAEAAVRRLSPADGAPVSFNAAVAGWAQGIAPSDLVNLAAAYRATADERYALAAKTIYTCRLLQEGEGAAYTPPRDPLAIPHRLGDTECVGWFGALPELLRAECFDDALLTRIIDHARLGLNHLAQAPFPARNIRMTQMDALLTQGLRLDFLPAAARWREVGLHGLNDCFHRQFNPDGSSIEATGWYHYIVANMALRFLRLKRAMPHLGLQVTEALVARAFDYTAAMLGPDGTFNRIGDSTAAAYPHDTLASFLRHRAEIFQELGIDPALPPCGAFYPDAGQALLRESWEAQSVYVTFDVTRRMGYHWHPACNAVQLQVGQHRLVADPGRLHYDPTPHRRMATSTRAHSTITLNGWQQSDASGRMTCKEAAGYTVATGLYDGGYWPMRDMEHGCGIFGTHHRTLLWIHGRCLIVIDNLRHTQGAGAKPTIENNWQLGQSEVTLDSAKRRVVSRQGDTGLLLLFALTPPETAIHLREGEANPCLGWIADERDLPVAAPHVQATIPARDPWLTDLVTILVPFRGSQAPGVTVDELCDPADRGHGRLSLRWDDSSTDTILWTPRLEAAINARGGVQTDAALIHLRSASHGAASGGLIYEGTYLAPLLPPGRQTRGTFAIGGVNAAT